MGGGGLLHKIIMKKLIFRRNISGPSTPNLASIPSFAGLAEMLQKVKSAPSDPSSSSPPKNESFSTSASAVAHLSDEALRQSWPWEKYEHNDRGPGLLRDESKRPAVTGDFKQTMVQLHGREEGMRMYYEEFVPRMKKLYSSSMPTITDFVPSAFDYQSIAAAQTQAKEFKNRLLETPENLTPDELLYLMNKTEQTIQDKFKNLFLKSMAEEGRTVYIPMQELSLDKLFSEFSEDFIPEEFQGFAEQYKEMMKSGDGAKGDMQPAFFPLPGRENDPGAPAFLPVYFEKHYIEKYLIHCIEATPNSEAALTFAAVPLKVLLQQLEDSPEEVVVGLNHGVGVFLASPEDAQLTGSLWLSLSEQKKILKGAFSTAIDFSGDAKVLGSIFDAAYAPSEVRAPEVEHNTFNEADFAAQEAQKALQKILDNMISLLQCLRRSVRFAYITSTEIDETTEMYRIGLRMSTAENDPRFVDSLAALSEPEYQKPKKRLRKRKRMTPRQKLRFRVHMARRLAEKKPISDLIHSEEAPRPVVKRRGKYLVVTRAMRRKARRDHEDKLRQHHTDMRWKEQFFPYHDVLAKLKLQPEVSRLVSTAFVAFSNVEESQKNEDLFADLLPFFDNSLDYPNIPRALGTEAEVKTRVTEEFVDTSTELIDKHVADTFNTLSKLRAQETPDTGPVVITRAEQRFLTPHQQAALVLGPRNAHTLTDSRLHETRKQLAALKGDRKLLEHLGPPGWFPKKDFAPDVKTELSYLYEKRGEIDKEQQTRPGGKVWSEDERHSIDQAVSRKAAGLGIEVQEVQGRRGF